ncbi:MAG: hypothetical protein PHW40_00910 [Candidatus Izemoplasmatales bacterium]|nr:hypothetical protein [Candidatus Izemoplasmatales bacterium]
MPLFFESPAGQPYTASWYPELTVKDGEERRYSSTPTSFWCAELQPGQISKQFRDGIEGKTYSCIIASTNASKLEGIEEGAQIDYDGGRRRVVYALFDKAKRIWTIALT